MKKLLKGTIAGLIALILLVGAVMAFNALQVIPNSMTIIGVAPEIAAQAYLNPDGTTPITNMAWGERLRGRTFDWTFYVKNEGDEVFDLVVQQTGDISGWGSVEYIPSLVSNFAPGDIVAINILIHIKPDAPLGSVETFYTELGLEP